jgi:hypothetical protein
LGRACSYISKRVDTSSHSGDRTRVFWIHYARIDPAVHASLDGSRRRQDDTDETEDAADTATHSATF